MLKFCTSQSFGLLTIESSNNAAMSRPTDSAATTSKSGSPPEQHQQQPETQQGLFPRRPQLIIGLFALLIVVFCAMLFSLAFGARSVPATEILLNLRLIVSHIPHPLDLPPDLRIVAEQRIPRTITAVLVGACLGTAGTLIQGHTRNPLADPGILGISHGAALAIVLTTLTSTVINFDAIILFGFIGAISATLAVFSLASIGTAKLNPLTLILGGAALSAVLAALTTALILYNSGALELIRYWSIGSFSYANILTVKVFLPLALVGLICAFATAPQVNLLHLGDEMAQSLGLNTHRARIIGIAVIAFLAAVATGAAGPVGFIGLVIPHLSRAICGTDYRWILPYSALLGALLATVADCVGRWVIRPGEIEVGIVLAFLGAPIFLWFIYRNKVVKL